MSESGKDALTLSVVAHGSEAYRACVALRHAVLREPLGMAFTEEQLAAEHGHVHVACHRAGVLVGCLMLVAEDEPTHGQSVEQVVGQAFGQRMRIKQVAVDGRAQGQGVGRAMSDYAEGLARERGATRISLHARATAIAFYEKLGYITHSEPFTEVGLEHRAMQKML